ncbi:MAG TPA: hypothetical protein VIV60_03860, partial [Polyangiaceae bacterium]
MPPRSGALRRTRYIAATASWATLAIGLLVITGWFIDSRALKTAFSDVSMKPNAALALCLASLALLCLLPIKRRAAQQRGAFIAAAVVTAIGGATLCQHLSGLNFGIDQLIFSEPPGQLATSSPGRMGPPACISLMLLGVGLLLMDRRTRGQQVPSQWIALCAFPLPLLAITGYAVNATLLYGNARFTGIALHTAIGILLLAVALLFARAEHAPASLFVMDNPGGEVARTMLPTAVLLPIVLGWVRGEVQRLGYLHLDLGRALIVLSLSGLLTIMVWRLARRLSTVAQGRREAELSSSHAQAEARRLAAENTQTLNLLEALLAHAPIGLVFIDRHRYCVRINEFLANSLDSSEQKNVGRRLDDVLGGPHPQLELAIDLAFKGGGS